MTFASESSLAARAGYAARGYVLAALLAALIVLRLQSEAPLLAGWLTLALAGALLRVWAGRHIGSHSNGLALASGPLAVTGPYRFTKHPLYVSNLLFAAGLIGFANIPGWAALVLWLLAALHHGLLMLWEDAALRTARTSPMPLSVPASWKSVWARQGRNIAYGLISAALVALAAHWP